MTWAVHLVAVWGNSIMRASTRCGSGGRALMTSIASDNVAKRLVGWIANGWPRCEKADEYFEAIANCRRAREVSR